MDSKCRGFFVYVTLIALTACTENSGHNVFPELDNAQSLNCGGAQVQKLSDQFIVTWKSGRVSVESDLNAQEFKNNFLQNHQDEIRSVEFDKIINLPTVHSDSSVAPDQHWGFKMIEAQNVWEQGYLGDNVKVGIVDAAVDADHIQLSSQISLNAIEVNGVDGSDDDQNGFVDDKRGWDFFADQAEPEITPEDLHGTHVAGIVAADSSKGQAWGVAPHAQLIPANFMNSEGQGTLSAAIQAIHYVAARGARVINASWGGSMCSQTLKDTVAELDRQGILFIVASGNDGANLDITPEFPAAFQFENQITVAASMASDRLADYSNTSFTAVHLAAPGDQIFSTIPSGGGSLSGTSMATPFVTGAVAVLWSARPNATHLQVKQALLNSVDVRSYRVATRGRLNLRKAIDELKRLVP